MRKVREATRCALLAAFFMVASGPAFADCSSDLRGLETAKDARDLRRVEVELEKIETSISCSQDERTGARRQASLAYLLAFEDGLDTGTAPSELLPLLTRADEIGMLWQASAYLGDLSLDGKDYAAATNHFQRAIDLMNDVTKTPGDPMPGVMESIVKKASESRMLAPAYVPVSRGSRGKPGGLGSASFRGIGVVPIAVPIMFEYDSDRFTEQGEKAVEDMVGYLGVNQPSRITLTGHTDERGSDQYNQALSERRVMAVKTFLEAKGLGIPISTIGKGESEPFVPDQADRYDQEELWQLNRRVELDLK